MFWAVFIVSVLAVAASIAIYRTDKKVKAKYGQGFNPRDWDLPGHIELPDSVAAPTAVPLALANAPLATPVEKVRYQKEALLFNGAKRDFIKALRTALNEEFMLLSHINAADVLSVAEDGNRLAAQLAGNNIATQQIDFVVCDAQQLKPMCVVLLRDESPKMLLAACASADLPTLVFTLKDAPDAPAIRAALLAALGLGDTALAANDARGAGAALDVSAAPKTGVAQDGAIELKNCPSCSAVMLKRKAKKGADAGKLFWVCSSYPQCRGMLAIN